MNSLSCIGLRCERHDWPNGTACVRNVTATFQMAQVYGIYGKNGSDKGLLLHLLGLLDRPDSGRISVLGKEVSQLDQDTLAQARNSLFGYLFRQPCLLPSFSVAENIAMPLLRICGVSAEEAVYRTRSMLEFCGLSRLGDVPANQLDAATQQQVSFIRALIHQPKILIAICPLTLLTVLPLARLAAHEMGITVLCAGDDHRFLTANCDRLLVMKNGFLDESKSASA